MKIKTVKYCLSKGFYAMSLFLGGTCNLFAQTVILQETFETRTTGSPGTGWTLDNKTCGSGASSRWNIGSGGAGSNVAIAGSKSLGPGPTGTTTSTSYVGDACSSGGSAGTENYAAYVFSTAGKTNIVITFKWKCTGEWTAASGGEYRDYGRFYCSNGTSYEFSTDGWINYAYNFSSASKGGDGGNTGYFWNYGSSVNNGTGNLGTGGYKWQTYYLPNWMNNIATAEIGFEWRNNNNASGSGFLIDDITIISGGTPSYLPIELLDFKATKAKKGVEIKWNTATETNNDFYTVERSSDGNNFRPIKTVKGAGNSTSLSSYETIDENPATGPNYYRLKQTDHDGKFTYFEAEVLNYYNDEFYCNELAPNPAENIVDVNFYAPTSAIANVQIIDITGRVVSKKQIDVRKGLQLISTDLIDLTSGAYYFNISVEGEGFSCTKKLIKN